MLPSLRKLLPAPRQPYFEVTHETSMIKDVKSKIMLWDLTTGSPAVDPTSSTSEAVVQDHLADDR